MTKALGQGRAELHKAGKHIADGERHITEQNGRMRTARELMDVPFDEMTRSLRPFRNRTHMRSEIKRGQRLVIELESLIAALRANIAASLALLGKHPPSCD